ncbi:MAG: methyltransferase domain-containing protein [Sphingobium sp.]|nr:methyltransferase domain-containing protein [Sphingobium sp.]
MNRTDGYTTDVSYPAFFHKEMQPVWLSATAHFQGFSAPDTASHFTFCELGCGLSTNLLVSAACHPNGHFIGVDFNEQHLQIARTAAISCGLANIEFIHADFAEFLRSNHKKFDFMASHGVWSWIAPDHKNALLANVTASLKPGGLFYLHYMCHPGSTELTAFQNVLNVFSHHIPGSSSQRVQMGLKLLRQLSNRGLFNDQPAMLKHLDNLEQKNPAHLAHEFLTDHWNPQHSVDVHSQIGEAGLGYLGSADIFGNLDPSLSIPGNLQGIIRQTQIPPLSETLKDMARGSHQRMDLFQKEPHPCTDQSFAKQINKILFHLMPDAPTKGPVSFSTPIGTIEGTEEILSPLLHSLATGPKSFAELTQIPAYAGQTGLLLQTLQLLMTQEIVHPAKALMTPENARTSALAQWFTDNGITLKIVDECGTALGGSAP